MRYSSHWIKEIKTQNQHEKTACEHLIAAKKLHTEILDFIHSFIRKSPIQRSKASEECDTFIDKVVEADNELDKALKHLELAYPNDTYRNKDVYKEYNRINNENTQLMNKIRTISTEQNLVSLGDRTELGTLSFFFDKSVNIELVSNILAKEAAHRAKEAEYKAKEAEQNAIAATAREQEAHAMNAEHLAKEAEHMAKEAEQKAIAAEHKAKEAEQIAIAEVARQKEAEAIEAAKRHEAQIIATQNEKANLELAASIRDKDAQIVAQARKVIEIASLAMDKAIRTENIQQVKEQAEIIKQQSKAVESFSGGIVVQMPQTAQKHQMFDCIFNDIKQNISPMLIGPAGSGKSTVLQQCADAMMLEYYPLSVNGQTSEYQIVGYKNANGDYIRSAFRDAYEYGGLFSFEEIDAGNPNVLTVMNNALSQDFYLFPDRRVKKHQNFRLAASANTYGRGANVQYIGRNPLDAATLDRFAMTYIDYDENMERQIGPDPKWTDYIQTIRHVVASFKMPIIVSTRAIIFGGRDVKSGTAWDTALQKFVWRGCKSEDVEKIMKKVEELQQRNR